MKYDRIEAMLLGRDVDVKKLIRGTKSMDTYM